MKQIVKDKVKEVASIAAAPVLTQPLYSVNLSSYMNSKLTVASDIAVVAKLKGELAYQHMQIRLQAQKHAHDLEMHQLRDENSRLFFLFSYNN